MAITISNQSDNHRSTYFEFTGDGVTTAIVVPIHGHQRHPGQSATAFVVTAPTSSDSSPSGKGGHSFPTAGTNVTVSSVVLSGGNVTVNTSAAVGNGTKAFGVVVYTQYAD